MYSHGDGRASKARASGFDSLTLCKVGRSSWVNEIQTSTPHGRSLPTAISAAEADRKTVIDPNLDRAAPLVRLDPGIVAHLGERLTGSQEAAGSTPAGSTFRLVVFVVSQLESARPRTHLVRRPDCRSGEGSSILLGGAGGPEMLG